MNLDIPTPPRNATPDQHAFFQRLLKRLVENVPSTPNLRSSHRRLQLLHIGKLTAQMQIAKIDTPTLARKTGVPEEGLRHAIIPRGNLPRIASILGCPPSALRISHIRTTTRYRPEEAKVSPLYNYDPRGRSSLENQIGYGGAYGVPSRKDPDVDFEDSRYDPLIPR